MPPGPPALPAADPSALPVVTPPAADPSVPPVVTPPAAPLALPQKFELVQGITSANNAQKLELDDMCKEIESKVPNLRGQDRRYIFDIYIDVYAGNIGKIVNEWIVTNGLIRERLAGARIDFKTKDTFQESVTRLMTCQGPQIMDIKNDWLNRDTESTEKGAILQYLKSVTEFLEMYRIVFEFLISKALVYISTVPGDNSLINPSEGSSFIESGREFFVFSSNPEISVYHVIVRLAAAQIHTRSVNGLIKSYAPLTPANVLEKVEFESGDHLRTFICNYPSDQMFQQILRFTWKNAALVRGLCDIYGSKASFKEGLLDFTDNLSGHKFRVWKKFYDTSIEMDTTDEEKEQGCIPILVAGSMVSAALNLLVSSTVELSTDEVGEFKDAFTLRKGMKYESTTQGSFPTKYQIKARKYQLAVSANAAYIAGIVAQVVSPNLPALPP